MKIIKETVKFPTGAESNPFFGALASALLPALGYTEETPYYCAPKGSYCVKCGNCNSTALAKHHEQLYHDYITFTGVGLGWYWPEDKDKRFQVIPDVGESWSWSDEFIRYIMNIAGLSWLRFFASTDKEIIFTTISESIDKGFPSLMKLGTGTDWHTITGYDDGNRLIGIAHPNATVILDEVTAEGFVILSNWYESFTDAIIINGRSEPSLKPYEIIERMITILEHPNHAAMEKEIMYRIDNLSLDNVTETIKWLNERVDIPIEDRFHIASCTDKTLPNMINNDIAREKLFNITAQYVFDNDLDATHGTCWKIWRLLGVSPWVDSRPAEEVFNQDTKDELKRLFAIVFENDRIVLGLLRETLEVIKN